MSKDCTKCGASGLKSMTPTLYHYKISGLDNVYLRGGVTEYICPKCGAKSTSIKNVVGLHQAIANSLSVAKPRLAVSSDILNVDQKYKFSPGFPPDPGEAGRKTIQGVDSDHDGVRDDVQRWIYAFVPKEPNKQFALRQMARYYQDCLRDDFQLEVRKLNEVLLDRAQQCLRLNFNDELHGYLEERYLKAKILNTYARTVRYLENDNKITTEEVSGKEIPEYKNPCDGR